MDLLDLHAWDVSPKEAVAIHRELASRVVCDGAVHAFVTDAVAA